MQATELSVLNIRSNSIGVNGAMAVAAMLTGKSKLSELRLGNNNLGDDGAAAIAEALMQATELSVLDLDSCNVGVNGTMAVAAMLKDKSKLSELDLGGNILGDDGAAAIAEALMQATELPLLYLRPATSASTVGQRWQPCSRASRSCRSFIFKATALVTTARWVHVLCCSTEVYIRFCAAGTALPLEGEGGGGGGVHSFVGPSSIMLISFSHLPSFFAKALSPLPKLCLQRQG